jgi:hypothetical protein
VARTTAMWGCRFAGIPSSVLRADLAVRRIDVCVEAMAARRALARRRVTLSDNTEVSC